MALFNNNKAKTAATSLKTVREQAANTIIALQNGTVSPMVADAIYKQSLTIVDSYRVQLKAVELAINTSNGLDYAQALAQIEKTELITLKNEYGI